MLLFPEANDEQFADGYAQAVTFGLLMARVRGIPLGDDLEQVGRQLGKTDSLIGNALRLLTDDVDNQRTLETSLRSLTRVLDAVDWEAVSRGDPDAWLYFTSCSSRSTTTSCGNRRVPITRQPKSSARW